MFYGHTFHFGEVNSSTAMDHEATTAAVQKYLEGMAGDTPGQSHQNAGTLFPKGLILTRSARKILPGVNGKTCFMEENHVQDHFVPCIGHISAGTLC